ncbi:alpha/beta fold hydrolase [Achromobacter sp. Root565]|uniref:alpha/beta fold hydrolase n=1 Tax=Achromobacter sp. Root565 TaxID=1736564 RepID=UPI0006FCA5B0|nr:alpha/beta fold hydrolase [Achromobacter sp. Root565]KRA02418.1 alpha/beta hydrolase [Achromobacter sp. Root565]
MTTTSIKGLSVEIDGDGPALLCIHGLGGSSNTWTPLMGAWTGFRVIRPDLPGSARSPLTDGELSIAGYVDALVSVLNALDCGAVHVAAHSLGTIVAQHLALKEPARVRTLALFGPLAEPPEAGRPGIRARAALARQGAPAMQEIADAIVKGATSRRTKAEQPAVLALVRESVMRQPPEGYARSCEALAGAKSADLERLGVPVLLVTGDEDGVAPPANVQAMAARIPNSRCTVVADCGHWTTFEQPGACVEALQAFHAGLAR